MTMRIVAIVFIFICTSAAWAILGGTIFSRTYDSGAISSNRVASTWGTSQNQGPPAASFKTKVEKKQESLENGKKIVDIPKEEIHLHLGKPGRFVWVALRDPTPEELEEMRVEFDLHEHSLDNMR